MSPAPNPDKVQLNMFVAKPVAEIFRARAKAAGFQAVEIFAPGPEALAETQIQPVVRDAVHAGEQRGFRRAQQARKAQRRHHDGLEAGVARGEQVVDRKSTRLNSSH